MAFRKLTPDVKERVLTAIRLGATYELACQYAGVSRRTLLTYRKDRDFCAEVEKAEGQAVVGWLAKIEKAASDGEWTAAAWKLERRYPELYGRRLQETTTFGTVRVEVVYVDEAIEAAPLRALPAPLDGAAS